MFMSLMIQEEEQQSTLAHYTLTQLSVYSQAMWAVLKALQHIPCQAIFSKVTVPNKCILTMQLSHIVLLSVA